MNLHLNNELFYDIINVASETMMINPAIIEKDYYVTYLLKELYLDEPNIIFKGGTSLSKCYKLTKRFSEDIDLAYDSNKKKMSGPQRKNLSCKVINTIKNCGFSLLNHEDIKSRRDYNQYQIGYNSEYSILSLKPHLLVETQVSIYSFPYEIMEADSLIYQYLKNENYFDIIADYNLEPFRIKTQSLERTYIDKVFAICDYYLNSNLQGHSRHLYDLYKIHPFISFNKSFSDLINAVRLIRSSNKMCVSARNESDISQIIKDIIKNDTYKKDYNEITKDLLYEDIGYEEVLGTLIEITNSGIF